MGAVERVLYLRWEFVRWFTDGFAGCLELGVGVGVV
jgi:hypothetical protein